MNEEPVRERASGVSRGDGTTGSDGKLGLARQSFDSMMALGVLAAGKALFVVLTSNFYGAEGQGIVALGIAVSVTAALVTSLGVERANVLLAGNRGAPLRTLLGNSLVLVLGTAAASVLLVEGAFALFGDTIFSGFPAVGKFLLMALIPLQLLHRLLEGLLIGRRLFRALTHGILCQFAVAIGGLILFRLAAGGVEGVLVLWTGGIAAKSIVTGIALMACAEDGPAVSFDVLRRQIVDGLQMLVGDVANLLNLRLDAYFVAYFLTPTHLGWYTVAATISEATIFLPKAFARILFAGAAEASRHQTRWTPGLGKLFLASVHAGLLQLLVMQALLTLLVESLLGEAFLPSVAAGRVLLCAAYFYGIALLAMSVSFGFGNAPANTRAATVAAGVNALLNVVAIPQFGIVGAAAASMVSYLLYCALGMSHLRGYLPPGHSLQALLVPRRGDLSEIVGLVRRATRRGAA